MELAGDVLPKTLRVKTAGGGVHIIFRLPHGVHVGNKKNTPVEGVDIRGNGGLIVGAGSTIKKSEDEPLNTYTIIEDAPIAEAPEWLIEAIGRGRPKAASAGKRVAEETDEMVARAEVWLAGRAPEEITEGNRDDGLYAVAAKLYDFGCNPETVHGMLYQYNAEHVTPPLDEDDIERIAASAGRNRREPIGILAPSTAGFEAEEGWAEAPAVPDRGPSIAGPTLVRQFDMGAIPPRPWVVRPVLCNEP
jgi:hypothetical protein